MNTLNDSAFLQLVLWHSANAVRGEVGVSRLQGGHQHILIGRPSTSRLSRSWQEDDQYLDIFLVRKPHLDAAKTTKVFVTLLLPFCNQVGIRDLLLHGVFNCVNVKSLPPGPVKKLVCKHHGMIKVYYDDTDVQTK